MLLGTKGPGLVTISVLRGTSGRFAIALESGIRLVTAGTATATAVDVVVVCPEG